MTVMTLDRNFRVVIFLGKVPMYCHHRTQTVVQRTEEPSVTSTNTPQMRISFRGTPGELRSFLAQLCLLAADSDYLWQLDASIARHPAGKGLRGCPTDVFEGSNPDGFDLCRCPAVPQRPHTRGYGCVGYVLQPEDVR